MAITCLFTTLLWPWATAATQAGGALIETPYQIGALQILRIVDTRDENKAPAHAVKILVGGQTLATHQDVSFTHLQTSPDGRFIVGLSNQTRPGTAFVVFDADGTLRAHIRHGDSRIEYCESSDEGTRRWYDEARPLVRFLYTERFGGRKLDRVEVNGCHGRAVNLGKLW